MIDSHCHLADETFSADLPAVVARARDAGLERALVVLAAGDAKEAEQATRVETLWPEVRFAIGVHPHAAHEFADDPRRAADAVRAQLAATPSARAIGEIGLDYHYDFSPRDVQQQVFRAQIRLARELDLPVVIHTREADDDTLAILREEGGGEVRGVLHCFTGTAALARRRPRPRLLHLARRHHHVSESRSASGGHRGRAARPPAGRNRQPVSGAGAAPRQAERAGARGRLARRAPWTGRADSPRRRRISTRCFGRLKPDARAQRPGLGRSSVESPLRLPARKTDPLGWTESRQPHPARITRAGRVDTAGKGVVRIGSQLIRRGKYFAAPLTDLRTDSRRPGEGGSRVRPSGRIAGRSDPEDRQIHPDERRQTDPSRRPADGRPPDRLPGRPRHALCGRRRVHPHRHARARRHHRRFRSAPRPAGGAFALGQRHHGAAGRLSLHQVDGAGAHLRHPRHRPAAVRRHAAHDRGRALSAHEERRRRHHRGASTSRSSAARPRISSAAARRSAACSARSARSRSRRSASTASTSASRSSSWTICSTSRATPRRWGSRSAPICAKAR